MWGDCADECAVLAWHVRTWHRELAGCFSRHSFVMIVTSFPAASRFPNANVNSNSGKASTWQDSNYTVALNAFECSLLAYCIWSSASSEHTFIIYCKVSLSRVLLLIVLHFWVACLLNIMFLMLASTLTLNITTFRAGLISWIGFLQRMNGFNFIYLFYLFHFFLFLLCSYFSALFFFFFVFSSFIVSSFFLFCLICCVSLFTFSIFICLCCSAYN